MKYVSTRGAAPVLGFGDVLLTGLATDGGLYVPETWPTLDPALWSEVRPYADVAIEVMWPYVEGSIDRADFEAMVHDAYAVFEHPDVCPVVPLEELHVLELFRGPTLARSEEHTSELQSLMPHSYA